MATPAAIAKELKQKLETEVTKSSSVTERFVQYWLLITTIFSIPVLLVTILYVFITASIVGIIMLFIIVPILGIMTSIRHKRGKK